ncbi:MAG: hypothetical protein KJ696_03075 [Gammaproteobacteria bacterium]|nr:hypothetical protein [Gammaproteobacteria bacterium]MBU1973744.1 hypothetical protein [Gammaproteobacteria bacterium]
MIELFEKHRAAPGAPYDEARFLDFLLSAPKTDRAVYNSFRGLRRFNAFIDDVQYEFAVCFSLKDREAHYSLAKFVDRVLELERSRRGSLASLRNQIRAGAGWQVLVFANLLLLIPAGWLKSNTWGLLGVGAVAVLLNGWFFGFARKERSYHARLLARIEACEERA